MHGPGVARRHEGQSECWVGAGSRGQWAPVTSCGQRVGRPHGGLWLLPLPWQGQAGLGGVESPWLGSRAWVPGVGPLPPWAADRRQGLVPMPLHTWGSAVTVVGCADQSGELVFSFLDYGQSTG